MAKVEIIIPTYNCEGTIAKALNSIINQNYSDWRCIVCDDSSSDSTWQIINEIVANDGRFILLRNRKNMGIAVTLNRCINMSEGEYIAIQDADDFSEPSRLKEQVVFLDEHKDVSVVGSFAYLFSKNGIKWGELKPPENPTRIDWLKGFFIIHASALMRREDIIEAGRYDARYIRVQDYDFWLNLIQKGYKVVTIPKLLYNVSWDISDYSRRTLKYRLIEVRIFLKGIRVLKSSPFYYVYIIKTILSGMLPPRLLHLYYFYRFRRKVIRDEKKGLHEHASERS